jgi:hypothetical protein
MDIFISSLITGMEAERDAVKNAIETLGHRAVVAEAFGAKATSPQVACLKQVREADVVVLILGGRYGAAQPSGLSATHEEFREAQSARRPLLVFVQPGDREPAQAEFVQEVGRWQSGLFYEPFKDAAELGRKVTQALHNHLVAQAVAPVQPQALVQRAHEMLPERARQATESRLCLALAAGPEQTILRPAQMEDSVLLDAVEKELLFSSSHLFARKSGVEHHIRGASISFEQDGPYHGTGARVEVFPDGALLVDLPARTPSRGDSLPVVLEEDVTDRLRASLGFAEWWLAHIDATHRISHLAMAVQLSGGAAFGWRTRREHEASPRSGSMHTFGREQERDAPVTLSPAHFPRQALAVNAQQFVEDLIVLLRRRWHHS